MRLFKRRRRHSVPLRWVTANIAISRAPENDEWAGLPEAGITSVLCVCAEGDDASQVASALGLKYRKVAIEDHSTLPVTELADVAWWIEQEVREKQTILIHCREGRGRSPLVACAALMTLGHSLHHAFELVRHAQPALVLSDEQTRALEELAPSLAGASGASGGEFSSDSEEGSAQR